MNVISSGPHILLFERDQQLVTLLSGELALAGYEVHTARTAVEVFDAIARFSVRLVMVDLAQAQAGRREFWVALDAQRRGRGVQVFTFRCTNLAGYGPDDPDERVDTVPTDLEVDGITGIVRLVDAVRARVPGSVPPAPSMPAHSTPTAPIMPHVQPLPGNQRQQPSQEMQSIPGQARPVEPARTALSTFTDKIRAVIYPGGRNIASMPEPTWPPNNAGVPPQHLVGSQQPDGQLRAQTNPRFTEGEYSPQSYREDMPRQAPPNTFHPLEQTLGRIPSDALQERRSLSAPLEATERRSAYVPGHTYDTYATSQPPEQRSTHQESSLDQLSRMLHDSQPALRNTLVNGNMQNNTAYAAPGLDIDQQELQTIRAQILRAAQLDEAYEHSALSQPRPADPQVLGTQLQLRASPIQDAPLEREAEYRRVPSGLLSLSPASPTRPIQAVSQATQGMPPGQSVAPQAYQAQPAASQISLAQAQMRPVAPTRDLPPETSFSTTSHASIRPSTEVVNEVVEQPEQATNSSHLKGLASLPEQIQVSLQRNLARHPEVTASDDMLLDIVKSLPPMAPAPPIPQPPPVLNGRATRSLGSVLLEGHLVPEERLQVAQHVQRMMRGVDLNYQLGEILLMFKLLTPDQLLAASLVSYGMISTIQISALGRIRQELHAIGLEYDLESLVILFRILTPEQMREVRASWSS